MQFIRFVLVCGCLVVGFLLLEMVMLVLWVGVVVGDDVLDATGVC